MSKKETIHLAIYDTMSDWQVSYVIAFINSPEFQKKPGQFQVKTIADSLEPVVSKGGLRVLPDLSLNMLEPKDSRMLILPGGYITAKGDVEGFVEMAQRYLTAHVPVAAICGATAALAKFGLLDEVPHTSNSKTYLEALGYKGGKHYQDQLAFTSGNLITASGVAPIEFAIEIFRKLDIYSDKTLQAWYKLYKSQDSQGFYELLEEHPNA